MQVLITAAATNLSQQLATDLALSHQVKLTDLVDCQTNFEFIRSDLNHESELPVSGIDAIVHPARLPTLDQPLNDIVDSANQALDFQTRCTYNLLQASVEAKVSNFVFLSTMRLFEKLGDNLTLSPRWRTCPTTEPDLLARHLGEFVCREFAREGKINITILRPGKVSQDTISLAVAQAITSNEPWQIIHLEEETG